MKRFSSNLTRSNWSAFTWAKIRQQWRDILIILAFLLGGGFASYLGSQLIPTILLNKSLDGLWFGSDIPRVFENMISPIGARAQVHPLFSLIVYPPVYLLRKGLGMSPIEAVRITIATVSSLWLATLFVFLRLIGCRRLDAVLFSLVGALSASAIFWLVVPETYPFGSLSILLALCFVCLTEFHTFSSLWYVTVIILTLSFTVTNGLLGILATIVNHRWQPSLLLTVSAFLLVGVLWKIQKLIFWIPPATLNEETQWMSFPQGLAALLKIAKSFVSLPMVMPGIYAQERLWPSFSDQQEMPYSITFSSSAPYTISPENIWGKFAVSLWVSLFAIGCWNFFTIKSHFKTRLVLGVFLVGQLLIHTVYGSSELFIYSLHFAPLLVAVAAFSTFTRFRLLALILATLLLVSTGVNNSLHLYQTSKFLLKHSSRPISYLTEK